MNISDLNNIIESHKVYVTTFGKDGKKANLCDANLRDADLCDANLCGADLRGANLRGANLCDANLCGADLRGANLRGANLPDLTYVIMGEEYVITITNGEYVRAGCQNHKSEDWRSFSKDEIAEMDGRHALKFYPHLLDIIDFYLGKGERPAWLSIKESK
ncbi:pentapeptide repeat-containing protein [Citrobacter sp. ANG330]|uniref:pentapeptide repeat-containing protein n=1 Tax=Citrobacter sp. ANG330 TaxID=3048142 RepID=UPI0039C139EB